MSFTTGTAQRRGKQAATQGNSFRNVIGSQTPYPAEDLLRQPEGQFRSTVKRRRTASVGDDGATGLVIHGTHDFDPMEGTDPDGATPPVSGATLANPDFPISYTGRGTLKFVSPVRIATVDGPLNVNGEVYSSSGLLSPSVDDVDAWTISVGGTGAGTDFTVDSGNTWATYSRSADNITLHIHYTWTSKNGLADGSAIFLKGLPFTTETQVHKQITHPTGVTPIQLGSYFVLDAAQSSTEMAVLSADSGTGVEVAVTGAQCAAAGSISFIFSYHGVIP